jgi:AraC-like DNA-binding protein
MINVRAFAPSADLEPILRQLYVIEARLPTDVSVEDRLFADNGFVRVVLHGNVHVVRPGDDNMALMGAWALGSNLNGLPLSIKGPFLTVGFAVRPSAWQILISGDPRALVDDAHPLEAFWGETASATLTANLMAAKDAQAMVTVMEEAVRERLATKKRVQIDEQIAIFEQVMRVESTARVDDIAARLGLSARQFERRCLAAFGLSPKTILRRSRFLDIAAALKGYGEVNEQDLAMLGYFDQSHRNREFRKFIGMTPGQFQKADLPLLDIGLSLREQGNDLENAP